MITPVEAIPFNQVLKSEEAKLTKEDYKKNPNQASIEKLESGKQPTPTPETVNALFDGAEGNKIRFETKENETIIKIVDKETDEVIRQIPPEELQEMKAKMEELTANFIDTYA